MDNHLIRIEPGGPCLWCGSTIDGKAWTFVQPTLRIHPLCRGCAFTGNEILLGLVALGIFLDWCSGLDIELMWPPDVRARIIVALGGVAPLNLLPPGAQAALEFPRGDTE